MKEEIKNVTILEKTVRPEKAKILKQVQNDMFVQDDMGWFRCGFGALAPEKNFSPFTSHFSPSQFSRKFGFTLAEVLITLGIIGVVAAMTMPSLIQKYQEKVTVNKLKKMYSTLSQAYTMYSIDNEMEFIPYTSEGAIQALNIFKPYLKIAKDCGTNSECGEVYNDDKYHKIILADGSLLTFRGGSSNDDYDAEVFYDVNGFLPPNKWGTDMFEFDVESGKIVPCGIGKDINECLEDGYYCTAWVITNENMDYLHCPEKLGWDKQHSCKK